MVLVVPGGKGSNFLGLGAAGRGGEERLPQERGHAAPLRVAVSRCVLPAEGVIPPWVVPVQGLEGFPLSPLKCSRFGVQRGVMPGVAAIPA